MKRIVFSLLLVTLFSIGNAQDFSLKLKPKAGSQVTYTMTVEGKTTQSMMGQEMTMNTNSSGSQEVSFTKVNSDGSIIFTEKSVVDFVKISSAAMDTTMNPGEKGIENYAVTVDKLGNVLSKKSLKTDDNPSGMGGMMGASSGLSAFIIIPDGKIKVGDSWTTDRTDTIEFMGGKVVNTTTAEYTLVGQVKKGSTKCLEFKTIANISSEGSTSMQGMDFQIEGTGKIAGTVWVESKTGVIYEEESSNNTQLTLALSGPQSMTIPMVQEMKVRRVRK